MSGSAPNTPWGKYQGLVLGDLSGGNSHAYEPTFIHKS